MSAVGIAERALELAAILDAPGRTVTQTRDALAQVGELRRLVEGLGCDLAGELHQADPAVLAERSASVVVEKCVDLDAAEARKWCRVGAALQPEVSLLGEVLPEAHPALGAAMRAGEITVDAADLVLTTLRAIEPFSSREQQLGVEHALVECAPAVTRREFAALCRDVPSRYQPEGAAEREELLRQKSGVTVHQTRDGLVRWVLTMHPEAAGFLTAAVDARTAPRRLPHFSDPAQLETPPDEADLRPLSQRRLDALVSMAQESLRHDKGTLAGTAVTMSVTVTLEALKSGLGTAKIAGIDEPISASTARRLAAEAEIIPVVLGTDSEQLDQGRCARLATEAQRRSLALRDEGCIWNGCSVPPAWCEVAHITPWALGGRTDLGNMALMCAFHHRRFDLDGWQLETRDGDRWLIPPPWVDSARTPRRAGPVPKIPLPHPLAA